MARIWIEVYKRCCSYCLFIRCCFHHSLLKVPETRRKRLYSWLVDAINSLKIESRPETSETSNRKDETTLQTCADSTTSSLSDITLTLQSIQEENRKLKTDLELAMSKLESLHDEVTSRSTKGGQSTEAKEEVNNVWNSLSDVCDRYQVHLASVIADWALKPEVAKTLSDITDQLMEKRN